MPVLSTYPTSRRQYLSQTELAQLADINITDTTEADDRISQAEELVDAYVGFVIPFLREKIIGKASAGGSTSLTLEQDHQNAYEDDYFTYCTVEIISGTGKGQRRLITASTKVGVLTTESFTTPPDSTSFYKIFQLGKFPRYQDCEYYNRNSSNKWIKSIPENVKRAVAAQVQFAIEVGDDYFNSDQSDKSSESLGDYSYTTGGGAGSGGLSSLKRLVGPKARAFLRSLIVRVGCF